MAIFSRINRPEQRNKSYPKLMSDQVGAIVLFTAPRIGTLVGLLPTNSTSYTLNNIGKHLTIWNEDKFVDYQDALILENQ